MLWKLPPFKGLPNAKSVWAWSMYDLANQSFTLLIITLLFPIYFREVVVGNPQRGDSLWAWAVAGSQAAVVLLSPLVGVTADCRRCKKTLLIWTGVLSALLTCALGLLQPGAVALAFLLFIPANIAYQLGENLLASLLPHLSTPRTVGRISAIGWASGYVGALALLIVTLGAMLGFGWQAPADWRPFFVFAGVWFALGIVAPAIILREPTAAKLPSDAGTLAGAAWARLAGTVRDAARFRQLFRFMLAFLVYGFGVQTMVAFAAILAFDFGISGNMLVVFVAQLTITAGIAAVATGVFQDRLGARNTVLVYLVVWTVSAAALAAVTVAHPIDPPQWLFWVIGNGIGFGIGGIGTASRALVARFSPDHRTAEFFGLWGFTYKLAAVIGVLSFGQIKAWGGNLLPFGNQNTAALLVLTGFFVAGFALLLRVDEVAGLRAARRDSRGRDD